MADISGLYPQPPQAQQSALQLNPSQMLDLVAKSRDLRAKQAVGNAFQAGIGPDGSYDPNVTALAIKNNPDATYAAPDAISSVLDARIKNKSYETQNFNLIAGQSNFVQDKLAPLVNNPKATKDDVYGIAANLVRAGVPSPMVQSWVAGLSNDPKVFRKQMADMNASAMGPAAAAGRINAPPSATGAQQSTSAATPAYSSPTTPIENPPGVTTALGAPAAEFIKDQTASSASIASLRPLQQALPLISQLSNANFGPGSSEFAKLKGAFITAGLINPQTSDATARGEVNKYLKQNVTAMQSAGRSDSALTEAMASNPNLDLTQPAVLKLVKNQIAMSRQDAAMTTAFQMDHPDLATNPAAMQDYLNSKSKYYASTDQRAFGFDNMTPQERADLQKSLGAKDSPAYKKFVRSYAIAKQAGFLTPEPSGNGQ